MKFPNGIMYFHAVANRDESEAPLRPSRFSRFRAVPRRCICDRKRLADRNRRQPAGANQHSLASLWR